MKILIIASCFSPKNIIGAVRVSKIAKYLIREGHELTIISPMLEDYDGIDNTLECDEFNSAKRITVPYSGITTRLTRLHKSEANRQSGSDVGNQVNQSLKSRIYRMLRGFFAIWRNYEWSLKVKNIIKKSNDVYDVVISSYPNVSAHDSAWFTKRTGIANKWIADFRDPLALEIIQGRIKEKLSEKQSVIVKNADLTTYVVKAGVNQFIAYPEDRNKIIWLPNGFDEEDYQYAETQNCQTRKEILVFSYAGGLYGGERDCTPLFKAIKELIDEGKVSIDEIRLEYAGREYGILYKQAKEFGVDSLIFNKGVVSRADSINMQMGSDCVIVATVCYTDNAGSMTGKIYEPIMMRRPILLLVKGQGKNSEAAEFVKHLKAGTVYEESADHGNFEVIKSMILAMKKEKYETGRIVSHIDEQRRSEYSYENIVRKLNKIITSL